MEGCEGEVEGCEGGGRWRGMRYMFWEVRETSGGRGG